MKFTTETGSTYEVDTDSKRVRRLNGVKDPTPRQGKDGQWRSYDDIVPFPIEVGKPVIIVWGSDTELLPDTEGPAIPTTITSPVATIE